MVIRSIRPYGGIFTAFFLLACAIMLSSCDKGKDEGTGSAGKVPQQFSGTLPVRILPEYPNSWNDLQALYSGDKRVAYSWERNGALIKNENTTKLSRKNLARGDSITVKVRAGDETGGATVVIGNAPPQVLSIGLKPAHVYTGVDVAAKPNSNDPDGDDIQYEYQWAINDEDASDNDPVLKGEKLKKGDRITLVVTPSDGVDKGEPFKVNVAIVRNSPPFFTSTPPEKFTAALYEYRAIVKDPDGDKITYSLASSPKGMTIDPVSGMISWPISKKDGGSHQVEVVATDSDGAKCSQKYSLNISLNNGTGK